MPGTTISTDVMEPAATDPLAGTGYVTVEEIGRGGMGVVFSAQHRELGHMVAVKMLLHKDAAAPMDRLLQERDRLRIEGQVGARLRHPNLVAVHNFTVTHVGHVCLVMELLQGQSLQSRLWRAGSGPLPLAEALDIVSQALSGLHAIHCAGLIHRDIKPENIFLCTDGSVKVLDLGVAKVVEYATALTPKSLAIPTALDVFVGSPRYMSPEQSSPRGEVDARTDLYAVGCVLYRLLTGRGPFDDARTFTEIQQAHTFTRPMPPSDHLRAPLPRGLDDVILRCLAKDPNERPASAETLAAELRRIELDVRETLGNSYITDTLHPPTTMRESLRLWQPPTEPPQGYVSRTRLWLTVAAFLVMGIFIGLLLTTIPELVAIAPRLRG